MYTFIPFALQGAGSYHAHNLLLAVTIDLGIPGLVLFAALQSAAGVLALKAFRASPPLSRTLLMALACGLLAHQVFGITDAFLLGHKLGVILWLFLGVIAALSTQAAPAETPHGWHWRVLACTGLWLSFSAAALSLVTINIYASLGGCAVIRTRVGHDADPQTEIRSAAHLDRQPLQADTDQWDLVITPRARSGMTCSSARSGGTRDLGVALFVRRDFVSRFKQTILGPLWLIIQPILTTLVFTVIFGQIASCPPTGCRQMLFYLSGTVLWNYFSNCLTGTSNTFVHNAGIFGKVYFPRLVMPLSIVISSLIDLAIQFALFLAFVLYFHVQGRKCSSPPGPSRCRC